MSADTLTPYDLKCEGMFHGLTDQRAMTTTRTTTIMRMFDLAV